MNDSKYSTLKEMYQIKPTFNPIKKPPCQRKCRCLKECIHWYQPKQPTNSKKC